MVTSPVTRGFLNNAHVWGLSICEKMGADGFDGFRQKHGARCLPRFRPTKGNTLHHVCIILYCWYNWGCYNGSAHEIWLRWKKRRVLAYARGIYVRSDSRWLPSWPSLLALICGARSRDSVQVGYMWIQTLTSLGLFVLGWSSYSWAAEGMPIVRTRGVVPSSPCVFDLTFSIEFLACPAPGIFFRTTPSLDV
jgi:hypothetical protein